MHLVTWILLFCLSLSGAVLADKRMNKDTKVTIAATHITNLVEENGSGIYQRIMTEALARSTFNVEQIFSPYKRAILLFENGDVDCIYSFSGVMAKKFGESNINYSFPLGAFAYYMFTPYGQAALTDPKQLESLRVGAVVGHDTYYKHRLNERIALEFVTNDRQNIKKLSLNRLDAMIGAIPDLLPYVAQFSFSPKHALVESYDRITCHKNHRTSLFLDSLSPSLKNLKNNGTYKAIAGSLYFDFDERSSETRKNILNL